MFTSRKKVSMLDRITTPVTYSEIIFITCATQDKVGADPLTTLIYKPEFE